MRRLRKRTQLRPQVSRLNNTNVAGQHRFYAEVQKDRMRATLLASGITAVVYSFLQSGRKCTCRMQASLLDEEGHLTDEGIQSILTDDPDAGHTVSGRVKKTVFEAADVGLDSLERRRSVLFDGLEDDDELDENWRDEDLDPEPDGTTFFGGINQDRCGICFGSGFVGGFKMAGGQRIVLTTESPYDSKLTDCRVDKTESPYRFIEGKRVVFTDIRIPYRQNQRLHIMRAWKNDTPLPRASYTLNRADILAAVTKGSELSTVEITSDKELDFTHIEIQSIHRKVPIDITQVPDNFHPNLEGRVANATLSLPPETPVSKFSVIRDSKFGRAWQVSQVNPHMNNRGVAVWYEVETRLVAQHELYNQLAGTQ